MKKRKLRVDFVDFWPNFQKNDNYFYHLLRTRRAVEIDTVDPDVVFFSRFGNEKLRYGRHRSKKVFYTGENIPSGSYECDVSFSFEATRQDNVYLPPWVLFLNWFGVPHSEERDISYLIDIETLTAPAADVESLLKRKTRFCSFIAANPNAKLRIRFCRAMQKRHVAVDCAGPVLNNYPRVAGRGDQRYKVDFLMDYRFNIAFENGFHPGYVTEKILHPFAAGCIPIYWGGTSALRYFNRDAFIWCGDMVTADRIIDRVIDIGYDRDAYARMISRPAFSSDLFLREFGPERIMEHLLAREIV